MNKLCKMFSVIVMILIVMSISISVNAYTNDSLIIYITQPHTVNGRTLQLSSSQSKSLTQYLQANPVSDEDANEIIANLESAKAKIDNSGATNLSDLSDSVKAEVMALVKEAGRIAGLDVQVDTVNEVVTIKDFNGNVIISATSYSELNKDVSKKDTNSDTSAKKDTSSTNSNTGTTKKLVYTGNDYTVLLKTIVAIIAVAVAGVIIKIKIAK